MTFHLKKDLHIDINCLSPSLLPQFKEITRLLQAEKVVFQQCSSLHMIFNFTKINYIAEHVHFYDMSCVLQLSLIFTLQNICIPKFVKFVSCSLQSEIIGHTLTLYNFTLIAPVLLIHDALNTIIHSPVSIFIFTVPSLFSSLHSQYYNTGKLSTPSKQYRNFQVSPSGISKCDTLM